MTAEKITTKEAAAIGACSEATIRKRLVPVEVIRVHVRRLGERISYLYSRCDAESLRDGFPIQARKHPDSDARAKLKARAQAGARVSAVGREVAAEAATLRIAIPSNTPTCCRWHAINHVRHEGTRYDDVLAHRRDAKGYSRADAGHSRLQEDLNIRIREALAKAHCLPQSEDCLSEPPAKV